MLDKENWERWFEDEVTGEFFKYLKKTREEEKELLSGVEDGFSSMRLKGQIFELGGILELNAEKMVELI